MYHQITTCTIIVSNVPILGNLRQYATNRHIFNVHPKISIHTIKTFPIKYASQTNHSNLYRHQHHHHPLLLRQTTHSTSTFKYFSALSLSSLSPLSLSYTKKYSQLMKWKLESTDRVHFLQKVFVSTTTTQETKSTTKIVSTKFNSPLFITTVAATTVIAVVCYWIRQYRDEYLLPTIPLLHTCLSSNEIYVIQQTVQRMGLMGKFKSVKDELEDIRQWHIQHGFKGGLVLRDLTMPLHGEEDNNEYGIDDDITVDSNDGSLVSSSSSKTAGTETSNETSNVQLLEHRECYYLYYEVKSNGIIIQQLFCRGTTLFHDILTCLQCWIVYDNDCQCYVHKGFRDHADRILYDVLPLLIVPSVSSSSTSTKTVAEVIMTTDTTSSSSTSPVTSSSSSLSSLPRSSIELYGHSLGGATASILSVKLRHRGYNVTKLITVGEPKYLYHVPYYRHRQQCYQHQHHQHEYFRSMLPKYHIRIENEYDIVPYVPISLFGYTKIYSNKIWLVPSSSSSSSSTLPSKSTTTSNVFDDTTGTTTATTTGSTNNTMSRYVRCNYNYNHGTNSSTGSEHGDDSSSTTTGSNGVNTFLLWFFNDWTESSFWNFKLLETLLKTNVTHRIPSYVNGLNSVE